MDGLWSSPDLAGAAASRRAEPRGARPVGRLVPRPGSARPDVRPSARRNTTRGSRRNIAAHYDLGNDFYRLFLDETLTYSSAVFADARPVARRRAAEQVPARRGRAGLARGQHVLEIGTRLGRLRAVRGRRARAAASRRSRSRASSTSSRANASATAGLDHLVDVQLRDYRDVSGTYDAIVSIEMLEAVGAEYLRDVLRDVRPRAAPGRPAQPPVDHVPGRRVRATAARRELDPDVHLPGRAVPVARGDRAVDPRDAGC